MRKIVLFAFNGESMCFIHVLLNALDMKERAYEVRIVIEGSATKLVPELAKSDNPFHGLYKKAEGLGLIDGACKACSNKMGVLSDVEAQGIKLLGDMTGHPSMVRYLEDGFEIITF
ncbi:MAG: cytoplasmic protein [Thermodesulfobacteriota bacterium]|nr:cytoplasmic protein [Thermodesulfobacteriota bacterium]